MGWIYYFNNLFATLINPIKKDLCTFLCKTDTESRLLQQVASLITIELGLDVFSIRGKRNAKDNKLTLFEYAEVSVAFSLCREKLAEEQELCFKAFIQANSIFRTPSPSEELQPSADQRKQAMEVLRRAALIKKRLFTHHLRWMRREQKKCAKPLAEFKTKAITKTPEDLEAFRAQLTLARISLSSPRTHSAMEKFKASAPSELCVKEAVRRESHARNMWIATTLDPWCKRHGITGEQGLSIALKDEAYNRENPLKELVSFKHLFGWGGQQNDFFAYLNSEAPASQESQSKTPRAGSSGDAGTNQAPEHELADVMISVTNGVVHYASSNIPLLLIVHDESSMSEALNCENQTALLDRVAAGCIQIAIQSSIDFVKQASAAASEVQQR